MVRVGLRKDDRQGCPGVNRPPGNRPVAGTPGVHSWLDIVVAGIVAIGAFLILGSGIQQAAFHSDEAHKISETYYFSLFVGGHLGAADWSDDFYARTNPPVGKYVMGMGLALLGHRITDLSLQRNFERHWEDPDALLRYLPRSTLLAARAVVSVFGVLCCVLVYVIGRMSGGIATGGIAALLLLGHPLFREFSRMAMTDVILLAFMTAVVALTLAQARGLESESDHGRRSRGGARPMIRWWVFAAATGVAIGLAAGTKLNGGLAGIFYGTAVLGMLLLLWLRGRPVRWWGYATATAGALAISLVFFVAVNPYLYTQPLEKMRHLLPVYEEWMLKQAVSPGDPLFLPTQKAAAVAYRYFLEPGLPLRFFPGSFQLPAGFLFFAVGVGVTTKRLVRGLTSGPLPVSAIVLIAWLGTYGLGITAWIPLSWPRYALPLAAVVMTFTAVGVVAVVTFVGSVGTRMLAAAKGKSAAIRISPSTAAAGVLWAVLTIAVYYGLLRFDRLPPGMLHGFRQERLLHAYSRQVENPGIGVNALFNMGDLMLMKGAADRAAAYYLEGLDRVRRDQIAGYETKLPSVEWRTVRALAAAGQPDRAKTVLRGHLRRLEAIRNGLSSGDAKVYAEFDRLIEDRKRLLGGANGTGEP